MVAARACFWVKAVLLGHRACVTHSAIVRRQPQGHRGDRTATVRATAEESHSHIASPSRHSHWSCQGARAPVYSFSNFATLHTRLGSGTRSLGVISPPYHVHTSLRSAPPAARHSTSTPACASSPAPQRWPRPTGAYCTTHTTQKSPHSTDVSILIGDSG
jgi:hypothetical protein